MAIVKRPNRFSNRSVEADQILTIQILTSMIWFALGAKSALGSTEEALCENCAFIYFRHFSKTQLPEIPESSLHSLKSTWPEFVYFSLEIIIMG